MSRMLLAAGAATTAILAVTVLSGFAATAPQAAEATGPSPSGEVVMGTLFAPPSRAFLNRVRSGKMGGVLLLGNAWLTRSTAQRVTSQLQQAACTNGEPLLIAVDQEGGIVRRLAWAPPTEAPAQMSGAADAKAQASAAASALKSLGIGVDFAPVVDTPDSAGSFLGTRAFSHSAVRNAILGRAFISGLQTGGVAATAKHFPGLGLAKGNTDNGQVVINAARWKLNQGLVPFQAAVRAGVKLVMVSTAIYPAFDSRNPAALSPRIIQGLLRQQLGFKGVTVTDALSAPATAAVSHAATRAMLAGSDLLVFGNETASEQAYAQLRADAVAQPRVKRRLAQAAVRIRALKQWLAVNGGGACSSG